MTWSDVLKYMTLWGPGAVIAGAMIYALYKLADKYLGDFIRAQQDQAESLGRMAQGTEGLKDSITTFVTRDSQDHREMMILLKVINGKIDCAEERQT